MHPTEVPSDCKNGRSRRVWVKPNEFFVQVLTAFFCEFGKFPSGCDQTCHGGVIQYSHYIN